PTGAGRSGTAVTAGPAFTVTQTQGCQFDVQPSAQTFSAAGGSANVTVSTAPGCEWSASSNASWMTVDGSPAGSGPGAVRFSVQPTTGAARSGTLTVAGRTIAVSQSQGCAYAVAPENASIGASGGGLKISVT